MELRSYKAEFLVQGTWSTNNMRFRTEAEAQYHARELFNRWLMPTDHRVSPSTDAVNYAVTGMESETPAYEPIKAQFTRAELAEEKTIPPLASS